MATDEMDVLTDAAVFRQPHTIAKIRVIALNTFRESVRDRVLYNLILFVLMLVGASVFISDLSVDQESKFIADLGLSAMLIFGGVIAIFTGVGLVYKEIDRRTIYSLLSKPVHRHEFIIGKYLGLCLTLAVNCIIMTGGILLALLYVSGKPTLLQLAVLPAALLIYLELTLIVAVALLFSSFTTPMLSALFSFAVYVVGHFSADLKLSAGLTNSYITKAVLYLLYYLLPNLMNFSFISEAAHGKFAPLSLIIQSLAYGALYTGILLSISALIFQQRNFK